MLGRLDVVVAAIHSRLEMDQATMTNRICSALRNPYVNLLAHPTGRVLFRRRESYLDMERVLATARNTLSRISYGVARRGRLGWAQVINTQALDRLMGTLGKERY